MRKCNEWADNLIDEIKSGNLKLKEGDERAFNLARESRDFRKKFEDIVDKCGIKKEIDDSDLLYN